MTTSKSPSSLSDPAFTLEPVGTAGLFGAGASLAVLPAVRAGGGIGFPWASSCRNAQAGFVQFRYLHSNREGPAVSPVCQLIPCDKVVDIPKTAAGLTCDFVHSASLHFFPSSHGSSLNTIPLCSSATGEGCE
jgi:hypothetical protein